MDSDTDTENQRLEALAAAGIEQPEKFVHGSYGCHEALHVSSVMIDMVATQLMEHPAVLLDSEFYRLANRAHTALFDLYQAIGAKHLADDLPEDDEAAP